ncbi:hypothetical protein CPB86DRAFT_865716 [Serendipita vermifera]|nr:hypothetical protein CPB86DRAFT_865716 [Serendipita vermifera]
MQIHATGSSHLGDDANKFKPVCFLSEHNPHAKDLLDVKSIPFGFRRRICPGRYISNKYGIVFAAALLQNYDIVLEESLGEKESVKLEAPRRALEVEYKPIIPLLPGFGTPGRWILAHSKRSFNADKGPGLALGALVEHYLGELPAIPN